ncbi:MAG: cell division/cell wall cluster transcriptional repressor MraZ [Bacteroidales bacterium]|nr:cell division/cell wall cluster transcriptional repressor MraZ [Bacteroidales bacterium]
MIKKINKKVENCGELSNFILTNNTLRKMERFTGDIDAKADSKGRVFIPAVFRKILQKMEDPRLIMRKDIYKDCLILYTRISWEEELDRVRAKLNMHNEEHRQFYRQYMRDTETIEMDANGRILIPKKYLLKAHINKEVQFLGMDDCIEVWSPSVFKDSLADNETFKDQARAFLGQ